MHGDETHTHKQKRKYSVLVVAGQVGGHRHPWPCKQQPPTRCALLRPKELREEGIEAAPVGVQQRELRQVAKMHGVQWVLKGKHHVAILLRTCAVEDGMGCDSRECVHWQYDVV